MIVFRILRLVFLVVATHKAYDKFIDLLTGTVKASRKIKR